MARMGKAKLSSTVSESSDTVVAQESKQYCEDNPGRVNSNKLDSAYNDAMIADGKMQQQDGHTIGKLKENAARQRIGH